MCKSNPFGILNEIMWTKKGLNKVYQTTINIETCWAFWSGTFLENVWAFCVTKI